MLTAHCLKAVSLRAVTSVIAFLTFKTPCQPHVTTASKTAKSLSKNTLRRNINAYSATTQNNKAAQVGGFVVCITKTT